MIRAKQRLGKYKIERKLGEGGFASVYRARDLIEGIPIALKILSPQYLQDSVLDDFRREVRTVAKLNHPNILPLKNADMIDGHFVMAFPVGAESLDDRLQRRLSTQLALGFLHQLLLATSHAHDNKVIHCDIKPDNLILFDDNVLMLTDFGISKVAQRTVAGSGAGTVGHVAPEQAMGKPSFRSDVFSIGLIAYRMFSGIWPEWPFEWPPPGFRRVEKQLHGEMIALIRRAIEVDQKRRFRDATHMLAEFNRIKSKATRKKSTTVPSGKQSVRDWRSHRVRQFKKQFAKSLGKMFACGHCAGPVSEPMLACPWCGDGRPKFPEETTFPQCCPRCYRGMKLDWPYCAWCYGGGFEVETNRRFSDSRYVERCRNKKCGELSLMPFMRYCPQCSRKPTRKWKVEGSNEKCRSCGWGVAADYWSSARGVRWSCKLPQPLKQLDAPLLVHAAEMDSVAIVALQGWAIAYFSTRSHAKTTVNEDSAAIIPFDATSAVIVVADGMGGHAAGEEASRLAIKQIVQAVKSAARDGDLLRTGIINGFEHANQSVIELGKGAGTTLSVVELSQQGIRSYHVGDSIALLVGNRGKVKLETTAHSPVGFGLAAGLLDDDEASAHEERHLVLNAVGNASMRIDIGPTLPIARRDTLLVASDGLSDNLSMEESTSIARKGPLDKSIGTLVDRCREQMQTEAGKPDDLTVVALRRTK